ncbi:MAG: hypothetical protein ACT4OP_10065 [Actinomycetota bacterium]
MTITGLRQRLENLEGVAGIQLELAEGGLSGIRVTLSEGADEALVLERVRAMLVTYGLRSPDPITEAVSNGGVVDEIEISIAQEGEAMRVVVAGLGEIVVQVVEPTPLAAARAVARGRARLLGRPEPEVLWIGLDLVGDWKILTVLSRLPGGKVTVGAAVVEEGWEPALNIAVARSFE